jgi:hypothetical protein
VIDLSRVSLHIEPIFRNCPTSILDHRTASDEPSQTEDGNLMLQGQTPTGDKFYYV